MPEKEAHTPGPLNYRPCPSADIKIAPSDRGTLWLVHYDDGSYEGEIAITMGENAAANAVLYAAAPDLLAACKAALRTGVQCAPSCAVERDGYGSTCTCGAGEAAKIVRDAIAAAEGRS